MKEKIKKQFNEMKAKHPDVLLLFQTGDFYTAFRQDATSISELLGLEVTEDEDKVLTVTFSRISLDAYLPKLVRDGKRVAICDQLDEVKKTKKSTPAVEKSTPQVKQSNSTDMEPITKISFSDIKPSPMNPRKTFDEDAIKELAASIKQHGLLQPITVRPVEYRDEEIDGDVASTPTKYEIVMGERRYRAWCYNIQSSNLSFPSTIPCLVREMSDEEALDAMITENLQRKDVDPIEEAFAFGQLHKNGKSIEEIALRFGKSQRFITERIKLDALIPELKAMVTKGYMTLGAATHICKLTEDEQSKFAKDYISEDEDEQTVINKNEAVRFTAHLFMEIDRAEWHKSFKGSCGVTCNQCPFNNANVGCLFYEMKEHQATCTNRERWNNKRASWLRQVIDDNADVLVKEDGQLETGKTVVATEKMSYYEDRCQDFEPLVEYIRGKGFKAVNKADYFDRYSDYDEDDDRLKEKLANNEVYRVVCVETGFRGTEVKIRYYAFKKEGNEKNAEELQAMKLVETYKENKRKHQSSLADKMRKILTEINPTELPNHQLSALESEILLTLILHKCSAEFRSTLGLMGYGKETAVSKYVQEHHEDQNRICRDFIRTELGGTMSTWNPDYQQAQERLLQDWASERCAEVKTELFEKHSKRQAKIEEQLTALGYNTDGTKMPF